MEYLQSKMDEMTVNYEALENENEKGEDSDGLSDVELQLEVTKLSDTAEKANEKKEKPKSKAKENTNEQNEKAKPKKRAQEQTSQTKLTKFFKTNKD